MRGQVTCHLAARESRCGGSAAAGDLDVFDAQGWLVAGGPQGGQDLADLVADVVHFGVCPVGLGPGLDDCLFRRGAELGGVQFGHGDTFVVSVAGRYQHGRYAIAQASGP